MEPRDFDDGIPLPLGTELPHTTVYANPIMRVEPDDLSIVETTDSGWPTVMIGEVNDDDFGIAADFPGLWHSVPVEEIDIVLSETNSGWDWHAIVAFNDKQTAEENGHYEAHGYSGYELVLWSELSDEGLEAVESRIDENVTPLFYTEEHPEYATHAVQSSGDFYVLQNIFSLDGFSKLRERQAVLKDRLISSPQNVEGEEETLRERGRVVDPLRDKKSDMMSDLNDSHL